MYFIFLFLLFSKAIIEGEMWGFGCGDKSVRNIMRVKHVTDFGLCVLFQPEKY